jgi:prepilin-type N-terminal cleavage/methylation domain-containing protein
MFARRLGSKGGFTLIETLIAVALLAMLMAAVGVAVHASAMNYKTNRNIFKAMNTARQAMTRITSDLRTSRGEVSDTDPSTQCSFFTADGRDITYRFNSADNTLYMDINSGPSAGSYVLCRNVTAMTFTRAPATGDPVRNVRISITVTVAGTSQTVASAAVIRRNM